MVYLFMRSSIEWDNVVVKYIVVYDSSIDW